MKKKKVTFYCDSMDKGGTEKATLDLVNNLSNEKYDITIVQLSKGGYYQKFLRDGVRIKEIIPVSPEKSFKWYWRLRNLYKKIPAKINHRLFIGNKQDIEVACGYGYPNIIVSKSRQAKKILWVHMDVLVEKNKVADMTKEDGQKYFDNIDKIVCVSKDCRDSFVNKFGFKDKTVVNYNVLEVDCIREKSRNDGVNLSDQDINIITIGRLTWQKGYDRLIEALGKIPNKKFQLYIIGEGEEKENLIKIARQYMIESRVHLLGYTDNPYRYLKAADLYVCSSRFEGLSLALEESIIVGTPVLTTECTGTKELFNNKSYGIIVNNSVEGLVYGLNQIMNNPKKLINIANYIEKNDNPILDKNRAIQAWETILDK